MIVVRIAILLLLTVVGCVRASSRLDELITKAEVIVIGSVDIRVESSTHVSFDINVEQVLKGHSGPSIYVSQEWIRTGITYPETVTVTTPAYGIWFLRATSTSAWEALPTGGPQVFPSLYFHIADRPLSARYEYAADAPLRDKLTLERAAAQWRSSFLDAVGDMDSPIIRNVFMEDLNSSNLELQCVGLAGLVARGQDSIITKLLQLWPVLKNQPSADLILFAVRHDFLAGSPEPVRQLVTIASDRSSDVDLRDVDLRDAAAQALLNVHTREALPFFASLLESTSSAERARGAFGFWSFANGCPSWPRDIATTLNYEVRCKNPSAYRTDGTIAAFSWPPGLEDSNATVAYWRKWWTAHPELHQN